MRRATITALPLILGLAAPALAAQQVWFDGATLTHSDEDPYFVPPVGERYGMINFWYRSDGQLSDGYVVPYQIPFPSVRNDGDASLELRFINPSWRASPTCPDILPDIQAYGRGPGNIGQGEWSNWVYDDCDNVIDQTLYNSSKKMGLALVLTSDPDWTYWIYAEVKDILPQDGREYNVQVYYSTGDGNIGPAVKAYVIPKGGSIFTQGYTGSLTTDGVDPGFLVPLERMHWQTGCKGPDSSWSDTCYRGGLAELFHFPSATEVSPFPTTLGSFVTSVGTGADLGQDGSRPFNYPPAIFLAGSDTTWVFNSADFQSGGYVQVYTVDGWANRWNPSVGEVDGGTLYADFTDPF